MSITDNTPRTHDEFDQALAKALESDLRDTYGVDCTAISRMVTKTNGEVHGISVQMRDTAACPTIYTDHAYEQYQQGKSMEALISDMSKTIVDSRDRIPEMPKLTPDEARQHITLTLVNTERNQQLLNNTPHFEICGGELSAIPRWYISEEASFVVTNNLAGEMMLTPDEVLLIGQRNINEQDYNATPLRQVLAEITGMPLFEDPSPDTPDVIVLSNENRIQGANMLLNEKALHDLHDRLGDYAILPSSIHEVLLLPDNGSMDPNSLRQMVQEVNATTVSPQEFLSDNVFRYDGQALTMIPNNQTLTQESSPEHSLDPRIDHYVGMSM